MPPIISKERIIFFAAGIAACSGCALGIGSVLLYKHLRRDAEGRELVVLRREIEELRRLILQRVPLIRGPQEFLAEAAAKIGQPSNGVPYQESAKLGAVESLPGIRSSTPSDDVDEFYDARSSEDQSPDYQSPRSLTDGANGISASSEIALHALYDRVERLLVSEDDNDNTRREAYELMTQNYAVNKSNYQYLWRFARASYLYALTMPSNDSKRKELCFEAKDYAFAALDLNDEDADVHKYCALTLGAIGDYVGISQKLKDGIDFKQHIDRALQIRYDDSLCHHLAGRWCYHVANLSWFERKIANTLFAVMPYATFDESLNFFLEAERMKPKWIENQLYIAMCYKGKGQNEEAKKWLVITSDIVPKTSDDFAAAKQVQALLDRL